MVEQSREKKVKRTIKRSDLDLTKLSSERSEIERKILDLREKSTFEPVNSPTLKEKRDFNFQSIFAIVVSLILVIGVALLGFYGFTGLATFDYTIQADFEDNGVFDQVFYNATEGAIELNLSDGFGQGNFTSQIFNGGVGAVWNNMTYVSNAGELPDNREVYPTINMTGNVLLLHLNQEGDYGEDSTNFYDFSGSGSNATCTNCPGYTAKSKFGPLSLDFTDGNSDFLTIPVGGATDITTSEMAFSVWFSHDQSITAAASGIMGNTPGNVDGYRVFISGSADDFRFRLHTTGGTNCDTTGVSYVPGTWHHLAGTYDGSNMRIWYDGALENTCAKTGAITSSSSPLIIGAFNSPAQYWDGELDEIALWNRSLSAAEIEDLYRRGVIRLNLSVRSCDDASCDGDSFVDMAENRSPVDLSVADNQYFQYKFDFNTTDTSRTPWLYNVSVDYTIATPDSLPPQVTAESPENNTINTTDKTPVFWFNATDETAATLNCTLWLNNTSDGIASSYGNDLSVSSNANSSIKVNTSLSNNDYYWWVNCSDNINSNVSEQRNISINVERNPPNVTTLLPVSGSLYNQSDIIELAVNVTDETGVDSVWANVTYPNGTLKKFTLLNGTDFDDKFNISFNTSLAGNYTVYFYGNDSYNNLNNSETTTFDIDYNFSFITDSGTGAVLRFGYFNGTRSNLLINSTFLQLTDSSQNGSFLSQIFDITDNGTWNNISWGSNSFGELPANKIDETIYSSGNANMDGNIFLYHLNNDTSSGENATYVYDFSGNNRNGTLVGNVAFIDNSLYKVGNGSFNGGNDDYISIDDDDVAYGGSNFTLSSWVYFDSVSPANSNLIFARHAASDLKQMQFGLQSDNTIMHSLYDACDGTSNVLSTAEVFTTNKWYHFTFVVENNTRRSIYINGTLALNSSTLPIIPNCFMNSSIGANSRNPTTTDIDGNVDEVIVFNRTLTDDEIYAIYLRGAVKLNLSVRSCDDALCSGESFVDINDTGQIQNLSLTNSRYFQYNVSFESDGSGGSPSLYNVSVDYTDVAAAANSLPGDPELVSPINNVTTTDRTPTFIWNNSNDADADTLTYRLVIDDDENFLTPAVNTSSIAEGTTNTSHAISTELDVDTNYYWKVMANDSTGYGAWSNVSNFTVQSYLLISLTTSSVAFGSMNQDATNNTTDNSPPPFTAENAGNIMANVTITGTTYFNSTLLPTSNYQFKIRENETSSFNVGGSNTTFINMTTSYSGYHVDNLDWRDVNDDFLTDIWVTVPNDEPSGAKSSTITFTLEGG